ncbi:DNA-protecting protein DprA, partial [Streptomyces sp. WAC 05379]
MNGDCEPDGELLDRVFLSRVVEPGDEVVGRWVREFGVGEVVRRLRAEAESLPGVSAKRWEGLRARGAKAEPRVDLAVAREAGVRFVCPGDVEWP